MGVREHREPLGRPAKMHQLRHGGCAFGQFGEARIAGARSMLRYSSSCSRCGCAASGRSQESPSHRRAGLTCRRTGRLRRCRSARSGWWAPVMRSRSTAYVHASLVVTPPQQQQIGSRGLATSQSVYCPPPHGRPQTEAPRSARRATIQEPPCTLPRPRQLPQRGRPLRPRHAQAVHRPHRLPRIDARVAESVTTALYLAQTTPASSRPSPPSGTRSVSRSPPDTP